MIIPELCSGCDKCLPACPVNCIYPFPDWETAGYPDEWWEEPVSRQRPLPLTTPGGDRRSPTRHER